MAALIYVIYVIGVICVLVEAIGVFLVMYGALIAVEHPVAFLVLATAIAILVLICK